MTLKEMAAQYRANIAPWRERAAALRKEIATCSDTRQRIVLESRLRMAVRICHEGKAAAHIMESYYEGRRDRDVPQKNGCAVSECPKQ